MKRTVVFLSLTAFVLLCCGCGLLSPTPPDTGAPPGRMVMEISIRLMPENLDTQWHYHTQQRVAEILTMLREMGTGDEPEQTPSLNSGLVYYQITVHYSNGDQQSYYLLSSNHLQTEDGKWVDITPEDYQAFAQFLRSNPEDPPENPKQDPEDTPDQIN